MEASCHEQIGDTKQARTLLLHAREILPDNLAIAIRLGNFYQSQDNLQEADLVSSRALARAAGGRARRPGRHDHRPHLARRQLLLSGLRGL